MSDRIKKNIGPHLDQYCLDHPRRLIILSTKWGYNLIQTSWTKQSKEHLKEQCSVLSKAIWLNYPIHVPVYVYKYRQMKREKDAQNGRRGIQRTGGMSKKIWLFIHRLIDSQEESAKKASAGFLCSPANYTLIDMDPIAT